LTWFFGFEKAGCVDTNRKIYESIHNWKLTSGRKEERECSASEAVATAGNGRVAVWLTGRHGPAVFYFSLSQTLFLPFSSPFRVFFFIL